MFRSSCSEATLITGAADQPPAAIARGSNATQQSIVGVATEFANVIALPAMAVFFVAWYGRVLVGLSPFGDAANHARIARSMIENGPWATTSQYPPLYHIVAGAALTIGGERGFAMVSVASVVALAVAVYLFAEEVTGSRAAGLVSALIAFVSPKMALYAGRMYMEVPLAALILFALMFLHRYLRRRRTVDLVGAGLFVGIACITKQQALFLLVAAIGYLSVEACWRVARNGSAWRAAFAAPLRFGAVACIFVVPVMFWMLHTNGALLPDSDFTRQANEIGARIAGYEAPEQAWSTARWDSFLESYYAGSPEAARGAQRAEARHVWPLDMLTLDGIRKIHSPYTEPLSLDFSFGVVLQSMLLGGVAWWFIAPRSRAFAVFFAMWLAINYVSFVRENDQQRYYVYLAFASVFAIPLCAERLGRVLRVPPALAMLAVSAGVIGYAATYLPASTSAIANGNSTQAYAPSIGGTQSVRDASAFLDRNLDARSTYYAVPTTEFQYYSARVGIFDYRIYFLSQELLARYFEDHNIEYVVVPLAAVRQDAEWNHVINAPRSFMLKVSAMYPLAYQTPKSDIMVYRVIPAGDVALSGDVDFYGPSVARFDQPREGDVVSGNVPVVAHAADNVAVTQLMFYIDGVYRRGLPGPQSTYAWTWDSTTVRRGNHTIWIKAVDAAGSYRTNVVHVRVEN